MTETRAEKAQRPTSRWEAIRRDLASFGINASIRECPRGERRATTMKETRAEKAQRLCDEGRVEAIHKTSHYTEAFVQGDHGSYAVVVYACGHFFCACNWGDTHSYTDDLCAHALAVKLAVERNEP